MPLAHGDRKVCSACRVEFPLTEFDRNARAKDSLNNQCKACMRLSRRKYRDSLGACSLEGCTAAAVAKSAGDLFCSTHYAWLLSGKDMDTPVRRRAANGEGGVNAQGYRCRMVDGRTQLEHRLVMEQVIGRPLWPDENVHHKNGRRDDNRPENLELWCKPQLPGQRVEDLLDFMVSHYAKELRQRLKLAPK